MIWHFLSLGWVLLVLMLCVLRFRGRNGKDERRVPRRWEGKALGPVAARAALRVDEKNPLWCVVHQVIAQQIEEAHGELGDADNQERPQLLSYYAGGARSLEMLRDFLLSEREAALVEVEEEE